MLMSCIRALVVAGVFLSASASKASAQSATPSTDKQPEPVNLLQGKQPVATSGVVGAARITDAVAVPEGDFWLTEHSAHLRDSNSYVIYDLGGPRYLMCVFLQGDNNDTYSVEGSVNGDKFYPIFVAPPVEGAGMRTRKFKMIATARFVRVQARGGDGSYTLSEMGLFQKCPNPWPPELHRVEGTPVTNKAWTLFGALAVSVILYSLVFARRQSRAVKLVAASVPVILAVLLLRKLAELYVIF